MRFLADMGVSGRVVQWLRDHGHDVTHLTDQGLQRLPNGKIFDKGIAESRVILTFDLDFGEIAALAKGRWASIVVFRLRNTRSEQVIRRLSVVLEESMAALEQPAVVVVECKSISGNSRRVRTVTSLLGLGWIVLLMFAKKAVGLRVASSKGEEPRDRANAGWVEFTSVSGFLR